MTLTEREKLLEEITEKVSRDNGEHFTDTSRPDYIKSRLEKSEYEIFHETALAVIYKKKNVKLGEKVVLISSHVDCVDGIRKPSFKITKKGNYKGTFDNAATNAVALISMLENRFADNVLIAFTGNEEQDSKGAKQVIKFLKKNGRKVIAISLDVTFDLENEEKNGLTTYGYASYTIDNLCRNTTEKTAKSLFEMADKLKIPFMVTRADDDEEVMDYFADKEKGIADYYAPNLEVEGVAYEDEAITYSKNKCCIGAFSLCLPTDDREENWHMHSDKMIKIKRKSFDDYMEAVVKIANGISVSDCREGEQ